MNKKNLGVTKAILENLYVKEEKSLEEIAVLYNCCRETIAKRLRKFQIPIRLPAHLGGLTEKVRKRMSDNMRGRKLPKEHIKNIGLGNIGKHTGKDNGNWKGGRIEDSGYVYLRLPQHPQAHRNGYVAEHRIVMEKHIGRFLRKDEVVHHINGVIDDNRIENLKLFKNQNKHIRLHNLQRGKRKKYESIKNLRTHENS